MGPRCYTISSSKTWSQLFLVFFLCHPWDQIHSNIESSPGWKKMVVDSCFTPRHDNIHQKKKRPSKHSPAGSAMKNLPASARDTGSIPGVGRRHMPWNS